MRKPLLLSRLKNIAIAVYMNKSAVVLICIFLITSAGHILLYVLIRYVSGDVSI